MLIALSRQVVIITAIAICAAQPASSRTFYIDQGHPEASDENNGTEDAADGETAAPELSFRLPDVAESENSEDDCRQTGQQGGHERT